tara:strand:+ start:411 stop:782 length:372 start_codon:yes stop_codon:yes gene_type:complete
MPRLPVDGKKVIEYRHTLGTYERQMLNDIAVSYRISAIDPAVIIKVLEDPLKLVQIAYSVATILEMFGFETGLPTPADIPELIEWFQNKGIKQDSPKSETNPSIWELLQNLLSGEYGGYPGGY